MRRSIGIFLRRFPNVLERVDVVALLDEWAARFFEELDCAPPGPSGTGSRPRLCRQCTSLRISRRSAGSMRAARAPEPFVRHRRNRLKCAISLQVGCEIMPRHDLTIERSRTHSAAQSREQPGE